MLLSQGQTRPIILIAHSHGGNVVLRALTEGYSNASTSVITLATPFLRIFPTWDRPNWSHSLFWTTYLGILTALIAFSLWAFQRRRHLLPGNGNSVLYIG